MSAKPLLLLSRLPVAFALAAASLLPPALLAPSHAAAAGSQIISGRAKVIDGDTIEIGSQRIRLEGIDAPEASQTCSGRWLGSWACGTKATAQLARLIGDRRIDCAAAGHDKYGRVLGWCSRDGLDINAEMVRTGYAWAFVRYSTRYAALEAEARAAKLGIWQGEAEPAWAFREHRWGVAEASAPDGCAIKGNVTANGRIYHMPWSPWYGKVRVEPAKGEQWFCSEADALKAGFRPVMTH